jgi:predicted phage-related endonuclease
MANFDVTIDRDKWVGGSDIPVIFTGSHFGKTRFELIQEKLLIKENEFIGNVYTDYGNSMEPKIRDYVEKEFDMKFEELQFKDENLKIRGSLDGYNEENKIVLEIKTSSNPEGSFDIYNLQIQTYMFLTGAESAILATYQRPKNFSEELDPKLIKIKSIMRDNELIEDILNCVNNFWQDCEKTRLNPFINEIDFVDSTISELTNTILLFEKEIKRMKELEIDIKKAKVELKELMQDKGINKFETPNNIKLSLIKDGVNTTDVVEFFDIDKFKEENEELYNSYIEKKEIIKTGKKGYVRITFPKEKLLK